MCIWLFKGGSCIPLVENSGNWDKKSKNSNFPFLIFANIKKQKKITLAWLFNKRLPQEVDSTAF
jgi:hypothetical protein